jgi:hypothetical protein
MGCLPVEHKPSNGCVARQRRAIRLRAVFSVNWRPDKPLKADGHGLQVCGRPQSTKARGRLTRGRSLAAIQISRFEPHTIFDGGDKVFVLIAFEATVGSKHYSFPNNGHLWQFNADGKVVKYDHVTDTAQMIRMAKGE